jgi:hypothetical protein
VLIKELEILRDVKRAYSRRGAQTLVILRSSAATTKKRALRPAQRGLSQISSLCVLFFWRIDIRLQKDALMLKIWLAQKPSSLISTSLGK